MELAMIIHPDKNPDTEAEFKQLAAVYNVPKDKKARANYERVLEEGLPEYRMPAMYDRKVQIVRHIGLLEGIFTLFVLATFIQYGMHWAAYLERKMNRQAEKKPKVKKTKKSTPKEAEAEKEEEDETLGPKPTVRVCMRTTGRGKRRRGRSRRSWKRRRSCMNRRNWKGSRERLPESRVLDLALNHHELS